MSDRYNLILNLRQCACRRAHLAGAEAAALEAEAHRLLAEAREKRRRYFRELVSTDLMGCHPTSFEALG